MKLINSNQFAKLDKNKLFYYNGKQAVIDILSYKLFFINLLGILFPRLKSLC